MYRIVFSNDAKKDLASGRNPGASQDWYRSGYDGNVYSRRITHEHRLVYRIYDEVIEVLVLSAFGHYKK